MTIVSPVPLKPTIFPGSIAAPKGPPIIFDAAITEEHRRSSTVTDNPIESTIAGFGNRLISDHVQKQPPPVSASLVISRYPDSPILNAQGTRHIRVWRQLVALWQADQVFDYFSVVQVMTGMIITDVALPRSCETTHTYVIPIQMRKLEFAGVDAAQAMADSASEIALGAIDIGIQGAAAVAATALLLTALTE